MIRWKYINRCFVFRGLQIIIYNYYLLLRYYYTSLVGLCSNSVRVNFIVTFVSVCVCMYVFSLYQQYTVFLEVITVSPPVLSGALRNIVSKACICQLTNLAI